MFGGLFAALVLVLLFVRAFSLSEAAVVLGPAAFVSGWVIAVLALTKVIVDDTQIRVHSVTGVLTLRWSDIDDLHCSPRVISIVSVRRKKRLKLFHRDDWLSLEPFAELQQEVQRRVSPRLTLVWEQIRPPLTCTYPGLQPVTLIGYTLALALALFAPIGLSVGLKGLWLENTLLAALGIGVIVPFFIRDYRRSRRRLSVERNGLRQTNGEAIFIPWSSITELVVREPLEVGYGSVGVKSSTGARIDIPRSLSNFGAVWHLVKKNTPVRETYDGAEKAFSRQ